MSHRSASRAAILLFALCLLPSAFALSPVVPSPKQYFDKLLADHWEWSTRESPESATQRGDHRYGDKLRDNSAEGFKRRQAKNREFLAQLKMVDPKYLQGQDRVTYDVLLFNWENQAKGDAIFGDLPFGIGFGDQWLPISPMHGPNRMWLSLIRTTPTRHVADYEALLKRLEALPQSLRNSQATLARGLASGWVAPQVAMQRVPEMLNLFTKDDATASPLYGPFKAFPDSVSPANRERLAKAAQDVIGKQVVPAFRALQTYVRDTYLPAARKDLGASKLPGGLAYYEALIQQNTTTRMTAKEVHELGLAEVARIIKEMDKVIAASGFKGTRADFNKHLATSPDNFHVNADDMLRHYRDLAKRADAELPRFFAELPRQPYGIRSMDASEGANPERYSSGSADGTRAGYFEANTNDPRTRPKHWFEAVLLHETVPGHHLQVARQQELQGLPPQRKFGGSTAYSEGWGLYAEYLGEEMGFYQDPNSKYGRLAAEMHRAARLVVDTGMHAFGWTREQTIKYLIDNAGLTEAFATAETDRYIVWPAQALAYKIGEIKIKGLRVKAKAALGNDFDLRRFHNAVLDNGALPLDILEKQIDAWIAAEKAKVKVAGK